MTPDAHPAPAPPASAPLAADLDDMRRLVLAMRNAPIDQLTRTLAVLCRMGNGHWQEPSPGGATGRPATHLYEIQIYGQSAIGTTPEEAARNWRTCALKQIEEAA